MTPRLDTDAQRADRRLRGLDGLRGLAALGVFGVHYNQIIEIDKVIGPVDFYLLFANGEYGVALFFILSGLLLSQPFWKSAYTQADRPDIKVYFIRRLARILPAYYLSLTILILISDYWRYTEAWPDILLHYSFLFNYTEFSIFSINAPFWTLAVEVQFYLLLPLLFISLRKQTPAIIVSILVLLSLLIYGLHLSLVDLLDHRILWPGSSSLTWVRPYGAVVTHSLLAHLPHFIIGVIAGWLIQHLRTYKPELSKTGNPLYDMLFLASLSLLFLILSTDSHNWIQIPHGRYGLPVVPLLLAALIISTPFSVIASRLLETMPLRQLGRLSYGFYIYHLPVLGYVDLLMTNASMDAREHWFLLGLVAVSFSLLIATVSYLAVERPILLLAHRSTESKHR